jgi:hypothetical protein
MKKHTREVSKKNFSTCGGRIAYVEIISIQNRICAVELPGLSPIFITKIKDKNNKPCWVSIPQGNDAMASIIGDYIDEQVYSKMK